MNIDPTKLKYGAAALLLLSVFILVVTGVLPADQFIALVKAALAAIGVA